MEELHDDLSGMRELEPTTDGGLLVTINELGVLHVDRRWRVRLVAGQRHGDPTGGRWFSGDGGPATKARLTAHGLSALPDGGFLIADAANCRVRRVGADGIITTVAGSGPAFCTPSLPPCYDPRPCLPGGPAGDGGPARAAALLGPRGVAATGDGGFLVAETAGHRIRRVAPDGMISTVAGTGAEPINLGTRRPPYTGQATAAALDNPSEVEPTADGGFLFSDYNGVHKVDADGLIRTLIRARYPAGHGYKIADGGTVFDTYRNLSEFSNGAFAPVLRLRFNRGFFPGRGERLPDLNMPEGDRLLDVEQMEGGELVASTSVELVFIAPPGTNRLGAAIARETLPALQHRRLVARSTLPARLTLSLSGRSKVAARVRASGRPGLTRIPLPSDLPSGLYRATLRARSANGSQVRETRRLLVGPVLPTRVAHDLIDEAYDGFAEGNEYVRGCKRFGQRRVDCIIGHGGGIYGDGTPYFAQRCAFGVASALRRTGYVMLRRYRCGPRTRDYFTGRPSWTRPTVQAPSLESID